MVKIMLDVLYNLNEQIMFLLENSGAFAPLFACLLIIIESIIPILPLFVFITINFVVFGNILGFIISWFFTIVGCMLSFYLVRKYLKRHYILKIQNNKKLLKHYNILKNLKVEHLAVLMALPFTPAFFINIIAGMGNITPRKFLLAVVVGKISLVYFWGFIGVSFIESLKDPIIMFQILILITFTYILSKIINKILIKNSK